MCFQIFQPVVPLHRGIHNTGFNVANGLAAMYPLFVPPYAEEGAHGERILPRWINEHCDVTTSAPGNLGKKEGWCFELCIQLGEVRFSNAGGITADAGVKVEKGSCRVDYEIEGNVWKTDMITVNGVPWPKMKVFAGYMYRLRVLGASISRSYQLSVSGGSPKNCAKLIVVVGLYSFESS
jgi:hypothetical protein